MACEQPSSPGAAETTGVRFDCMFGSRCMLVCMFHCLWRCAPPLFAQPNSCLKKIKAWERCPATAASAKTESRGSPWHPLRFPASWPSSISFRAMGSEGLRCPVAAGKQKPKRIDMLRSEWNFLAAKTGLLLRCGRNCCGSSNLRPRQLATCECQKRATWENPKLEHLM